MAVSNSPLTSSDDLANNDHRASVFQLFLATTPLLGILNYFLYLAYKRPSLDRYNLADDATDEEVEAAWNEPEIPLIELFFTFLIFLTIWSWLAIHMSIFIPKRRGLIQEYINAPGVRTVIGDVEFNNSCATSLWQKILDKIFTRSDYATVTYTIEKSSIGENFMDEDEYGSWLCGAHINKSRVRKQADGHSEVSHEGNAPPNVTALCVRKTIRTFFPFDRERIAIMLLPGKPKSGIPRSDIDRDISTHASSRKRIFYLTLIANFWLLFTFCGCIYILVQMGKINNDVLENDELGWILFSVTLFGIIPLTAGGGNWIRFFMYRKFYHNNGIVKPKLPNDHIGVNYVHIS
mmetsp:Transcript_364/g.452  ORF Transcript_364/g.452 Transcript_364/m.452 type:complete len:349 (-) Transcript_364:1121-2167(-)